MSMICNIGNRILTRYVETATRPHEFSAEFSDPLDDVAELYGEDVLPKNGILEVTERPGLGIALNEAAVSRG
ncbi:MAG: hypothetical protein OXD31_18580 [Chloroflexi bacterium]|nr:hypothetical protein [Chloroflexota bacterium]